MKRIYTYGLLVCTSLPAFAKTIEANQHRSITEAVTLSSNGDTVLVTAGEYKEHGLIINKSIVLKGIGHPVIDGESKYEVVSITADNVILDGFTVINSGSSAIEDYAGIKIVNSKNVVIRNNILKNNFFGIYSQYGIRCHIENNHISSNAVSEQLSGNGIHCWKSDSMYITGNTISGHRDGIYFEFVTNSIIW